MPARRHVRRHAVPSRATRTCCGRCKHPEMFSSKEVVGIGGKPLIPLQVDPPEHAKYRRLLDPEFSPKKMAAIEPDARTAREPDHRRVRRPRRLRLPRGLRDAVAVDAVPRVMGLPQSDLAKFLRWRDDTIRPDVAPDDWEGAQRSASRPATTSPSTSRVRSRSSAATPTTGLLGRLVARRGRRPTAHDEELLGICHLLLLGGLDTVTATLDCAIVVPRRHPERRQRLVDDPAIVAAAVEELLRAETPVMVRAACRRAGLHESAASRSRPATTRRCCIGAANGDDAEFDDAPSVDFDRDAEPSPRVRRRPAPLPRFAPGAHGVAVALEEFHRRIPDYEIADGTEIHYSPGIRQAEPPAAGRSRSRRVT